MVISAVQWTLYLYLSSGSLSSDMRCCTVNGNIKPGGAWIFKQNVIGMWINCCFVSLSVLMLYSNWRLEWKWMERIKNVKTGKSGIAYPLPPPTPRPFVFSLCAKLETLKRVQTLLNFHRLKRSGRRWRLGFCIQMCPNQRTGMRAVTRNGRVRTKVNKHVNVLTFCSVYFT